MNQTSKICRKTLKIIKRTNYQQMYKYNKRVLKKDFKLSMLSNITKRLLNKQQVITIRTTISSKKDKPNIILIARFLMISVKFRMLMLIKIQKAQNYTLRIER
jgi:hypothetical protein